MHMSLHIMRRYIVRRQIVRIGDLPVHGMARDGMNLANIGGVNLSVVYERTPSLHARPSMGLQDGCEGESLRGLRTSNTSAVQVPEDQTGLVHLLERIGRPHDR
jgi:hypothetical protein